MSDTNPQITCTWRDESECVNCSLRWRLGCRQKTSEYLFFLLGEVPSFFIAIVGLIMLGLIIEVWWPLIVLLGTCVVFWVFGLETRVLCSHCPYWAEDSKTLHCWALTGSPKIWRYQPGPMAGWEKATLLGFFLFTSFFPVGMEAFGIAVLAGNRTVAGLYALLGMIGITIATVLTQAQFWMLLMYYFCRKCVNFSCPLNMVPRWMVDEYLKKNPVMRDAWEKSGYTFCKGGSP
jgi:hypothetical protein